MSAVAAPFERRKLPAAVRRQRFLISVAEHSILIATALAFLAPVVFMTLTALMTSNQALSSELWPKTFEWGNFAEVFHKSPLLTWTLNTTIYAGLATLGVVVSSIPVAYALSRMRWKGRDAVFLVVLVALMLPPQVAVVPLYVMWAKLGLIGTLWPLIIPVWLGDAFAIFLLRQFFLTHPRGVPRRRARRRLRRVPHPYDRRRPPRQARDRRRRALLRPLLLQRLLPAAALRGREPGQLGHLDRALPVPLRCTRCSGTSSWRRRSSSCCR